MTERAEHAWWSAPAEELLHSLDVDPEYGLSAEQVTRNREKYGSNRLEDGGPTRLWTLLWESVKSPMMALLLSIAGISLALGQLREAAVMVFVVAMYIGVHLLNKARSDRTMARLREVQKPKTLVLRAGEQKEIDNEQVVVGDILPLQPGERAPVDARLISSAGLVVNEAALTGESTPVYKQADAKVAPDAPLAERPTAIFAGTTLLDGGGKALAMAVGSRSELGRVARLATRPDAQPTPLQKEMNDLARTLAFVAVGVSLLIPLAGLLRGFDLQQMILTWLSLTFLMTPGQPPIIIAMALALAALELARKQVIVRRLQGAETLGSVDVALSDKTGTMTENKMELSGVLLPGGEEALLEGQNAQPAERLDGFFQAALRAIPENSQDPTDLAVREAADRLQNFERRQPGRLVNQVGFSHSGAYRSLEYSQDGARRTYLAGRPEFIIERSSAAAGEPEWSAAQREALQEKIAALGRQGKRLTAYAFRQDGPRQEEPQGLTFAGVAILSDPIRPEVKGAVRRLEEAGVRTVLITGDIRETALYVANEVGIQSRAVLTGAELEKKSEAELEKATQEVSVYARTTPEQKLALVKAYQRQGQVVAVTGDGINDAPALKTAQIGIAMGQTGTDVAKEAADLILTDDDFAHLPDGVAIGRKAYDNFRKGILYYLSAKAILLSIFIVPLLVGAPFPLAPIQIIFTELLMDLASSTIFVTEAAEPDVMQRKPRQPGRFLTGEVARRIGRNMLGLTIALLVVYFGSLALGYSLNSSRTAVFATWLLGHIVLAMNLKQEQLPLLKQGLFSNRFAAGWLAGMIALTLAMTFVPSVQNVLQTTGLSGLQWGLVVAGALLASLWIEARKWLRQGRPAGSPG